MTCAWAQKPVISAVLNVASYTAALAPGSLVAISGSGLANTTATASSTPTTTLAGVSVTVNGTATQLRYVSPTQINALIPFDVAIPATTAVPLIVTSGGQVSQPYAIRLLRTAPALFTRDGSGSSKALILDQDSAPVDTVSPGQIVSFFATGLGPTSKDSNAVVEDLQVYLGDRQADVVSAHGYGFDGFYRIDVTAPALATDRVYLQSNGWQSNIAEIGIARGNNVSNASGSMNPLFPLSGGTGSPATNFALMLHAGSFTASLDILPSATAFDIAAVGQAGGAIISIDPAATCENDAGANSKGAYTATIGTLTPASIGADFSGSIFPLWDYLTCSAQLTCFSFPLSIIPPSRLPPSWLTE
jgi:uncharacterized protein (TIGR03437 family)